MKQKLLIIGGPTAVGKSDISIKLASKLNAEIISADSMQIYKYMDIGSAKITKEEMKNIKHYMIDIIEPDKNYTVAEYKKDATKCLDDIINRNKFPIITGGTGLYINSVTCKMDFTNAYKDEEYREELEKIASDKGNFYLHEMLKDIDPISYKAIHMNNVKRVIRALEVYKITKKPFSSFNAGDSFYDSKYDIYYYVLTMDRQKLYERINKRVDIMIENGLISECKKLHDSGLTKENQSMQGIGYKEILSYFNDEITLKDAVELIKKNSRNYAKRQLTWFRRDPRCIFLDKDKLTEEKMIEKILNDLNNKENI